MVSLAAIDKPLPLAKLAYESLRDSILAGHLVPGQVYSEKQLAEELQISKTPVREALLELSAQGLVSFLPRRGVIVNRFTEADMEEVFEVRLIIESAVAEKAARLVPAPDLAPVERALSAQEAAMRSGDMEAFVDADRKLHVVFGGLVRNRRLSAMLENVRDVIHVVGMHVLTDSARQEEVVAEHRSILEAIRSGKPEQARSAMAEHITRTRDLVLEHLRGQTAPSR